MSENIPLHNSSESYNGPYNPALENFHEIGAGILRLMSLGTEIQRDNIRAYQNFLKLYGLPDIMSFGLKKLERVSSANATMMERLSRDYDRPEFGLHETKIDEQPIAVHEKIVDGCDLPFGSLVHFEREIERSDPKVLLVAPMSGHYATLLRPTVERLLPEAEVYITDWADAKEVDPSAGKFDLNTYADYLQHFIKTIGPDVNVISICQSTVTSVMAISRLAEDSPDLQPRSLTLMAGPLDPSAAPTDVTRLADKMNLDSYLNSFIARSPNGRKTYPGYVQLMSFIAMNPDSHFSSHRDLYNHYVTDATHPDVARVERFYDEYFTTADLTAEFYQQTVKSVFIDKDLANDRMQYNDSLVNPAKITCPIIGIEGEKDDISAPGQTKDFLSKFTGSDDVSYYQQPNAGHYGVFAGGHWRGEIAPRIITKIREIGQKSGDIYDDSATEKIELEKY